MVSSHALPLSFGAALVVHAGVAVCIGLFGSLPVTVMPVISYRSGESASEITIVPTRASQAQQATTTPKEMSERILEPSPQPPATKIGKEIPTDKDSTTQAEPIIQLITHSLFTLSANPRASRRTLSPLVKKKPTPQLPSPPQASSSKSSVSSQEIMGDLKPKGVNSLPVLISTVNLVHPLGSLRRGEEGRPILKIALLPTGYVKTVELYKSCGYPLLDRAAVEAHRSARYTPAMKNGIAMLAPFLLPVNWKTPVQYVKKSR